MENLQANLTLIQQRLAAASDGKYPVPKLIAVTKTHPAEDILPLQNLGVTDIAGNHGKTACAGEEFSDSPHRKVAIQ
jgi:uncharacterized pyridoxal phosphate-containing UPF0001 family protein